jgi:hypothetical protein
MNMKNMATEYLMQLDNVEKIEYYATMRDHAEEFINEFVQYCEEEREVRAAINLLANRGYTTVKRK